MSHDEAKQTMAAERYVLDEMPEREREAYEDHFFNCGECAADVRATAAFVGSTRALVADRRRSTDAHPRRGIGWIATTAAAAAVVLAFVVGYQNIIVIPRLTAVERNALTVAPQSVTLPLASRGAADELTLRANALAALYEDIEPGDFASYRVTLLDSRGNVRGEQSIAAEQTQETVVLLLRPLPAGSYVMVIEGVRKEGNRTEIARHKLLVRGA